MKDRKRARKALTNTCLSSCSAIVRVVVPRRFSQWGAGAVAASIAVSTTFATAVAAVKISAAATKNVSCSNGLCAPTAQDAVLNVNDLESLLAAGSVEVTTTGSGVEADDINVNAAISWSSQSTLALHAHKSIAVDKPISLTGVGGLTIATSRTGRFSFSADGNVSFASLSSALTINSASYVLVGDIANLASDIAANSSGNFALANSYDASGDGTYLNTVVPTEFSGAFEGLGNTISNVSINGTSESVPGGFFSELGSNGGSQGTVENITLRKFNFVGIGSLIGALVGINLGTGTIGGSFVNGTIISTDSNGPLLGLLVGFSPGKIERSGAVGKIASDQSIGGGGLVGEVTGSGSIVQSYSDCDISAGSNSVLGGLVAKSDVPIAQSYAFGKLSAGGDSDLGGLLGDNGSSIAQVYSTTKVLGGGHNSGNQKGGLIGADFASRGSISDAYWDRNTSGVKKLSHGAGNVRNDPGITGLTTTELQSGLPSGFDSTVWAQDQRINGGLPYLIANPPRK